MSWESIRNLTLRSCNLSYYESIANILSGCPILETLELIYCRNLPQRLNLSKSLSLRRLEIKWSFKSSYPVEIVAPHIHYLKLTMYEESCTLVDVSSVTQASLEIFFNNKFFWVAEFVQIMVLKMLEKLQNIERLTLGRTLLQLNYDQAQLQIFPVRDQRLQASAQLASSSDQIPDQTQPSARRNKLAIALGNATRQEPSRVRSSLLVSDLGGPVSTICKTKVWLLHRVSPVSGLGGVVQLRRWSLFCFAVSWSEQSLVSAVRLSSMASSRLFRCHITSNIPALSLSTTSGVDGGLVSQRCLLVCHVCSSPFVWRLAYLVSCYCCTVQRLFGQSSVTISTRSLAVWCLGALYISTRCYEALGKLFSDGSLSLRADHRGSQNYRVLALG
ncbi:hypothetical protein DY000_02030421 [Brassica cretica]|uniref:F-box/LRR-repeat protein 15/At3g58940/PEG3-like LRR domain-containing protein n=1 Tax=Brassica cretica TaxID=69181 RepID=A0ABQ7DGC0_BRACR|nr:hypothetical protein DY000_02030421 [Brassica cretica]